MRTEYALRCALFASAAVLALAGCERHDAAAEQAATPGQKLDSALERTQRALAQATAKTEEKVESAGERIAQGSRELAAKAKDAVTPDHANDSRGAETRTTTATDGSTVTTTVTTGPKTQAITGGGEGGSRMADAAITASIKTDYLKDPDLSVLKIDVDTRDGVVTLNGLAENEAARVRAERIAGAIKGVREVRNYLTVKRA